MEQLRFQWKDDVGVDRMTVKLPKGEQQLYPTALIHIDSLDIEFEWRK